MTEGSECRLLSRVVRCTPHGWEVEPDQRDVDILIQDLDHKGANGMTTPWDNESRNKEEENSEELTASDATRYRNIAARAN